MEPRQSEISQPFVGNSNIPPSLVVPWDIGLETDTSSVPLSLLPTSHQPSSAAISAPFNMPSSLVSPIEELPSLPCFPGSQCSDELASSESSWPECCNVANEMFSNHQLTSTANARKNSSDSHSEASVNKRSTNPRRACRGGRKSPSREDTKTKERLNSAHALVERRYREGLKNKLQQLEDALTQVHSSTSSDETTVVPEQVNSITGKKKKVDVLSDAMNYIYTSEVEIRHLSDELIHLNSKVEFLEKLVKCDDWVKQMNMVRLQQAA
jgi:Helix-loop-helix DNA-binding domain